MFFLDDLKIKKENKELGFRICDWIKINNEYHLSIQCGNGAYCIPRENISLDKYTHFEIAFIYLGKLSYSHDDLLKDFKRKEELKEYKNGTVYPYVPVDLIEDLYKYLKKIN